MTDSLNDQPIVFVIDFGAQYSKLIARRIREANIFSRIIDSDISATELASLNPAGIVLSGGPKSVNVTNAPKMDPAIYELGIPILGICYGAQLMVQQLGGKVAENESGQYGRTQIEISHHSKILPEQSGLEVWMSHFDAIVDLPPDFVATCSSSAAPIAGFENAATNLYGVQFHPEVVHTQDGKEILGRFLNTVCGMVDSWHPESIVETAIAKIRAEVGGEMAICGLSGGVDSAVAATIVHRAIADQLTCILIDNGMMRQGEIKEVQAVFGKSDMPELVVVDAAQSFLDALAGITDAEEKRRAVGECFISTFETTAKKLDRKNKGASKKQVKFLVQGTIYPDIIESGAGTKDTAVIKSHHNVGGLPEKMELSLIEPLRDLFKDEVREVGESLGLPKEIVWRQPFPGPGLAVRIIGEVDNKKVEILQQADAIIRAETEFLGREIWQAFGVLLDVKTVGVMGDERTYCYPLVVRVVSSEDAMTADWVRLPYETLEKISARITNEVEDINRVAYDITSKPPATIEWE